MLLSIQRRRNGILKWKTRSEFAEAEWFWHFILTICGSSD